VGPILFLAFAAVFFAIFRRPILGLVDRVRLPEVSVLRVVKTSAATAASAIGTSANGYIVAKTRAALSADTPGRIVQMNVEEGSVVKKGDVVAKLYADEYAAFLRRAEADLVLAQAGLERSAAERKVAEDDLARLLSLRGAARRTSRRRNPSSIWRRSRPSAPRGSSSRVSGRSNAATRRRAGSTP
jgi:multidrug efflux pump subunit AcrA (membrane-fusion protein)